MLPERARLGAERAVSIADGRGNTLHRQLFVIEVADSGEMRLRQPTVFLDLIPAGAKITANPPITPDRGEVERFLLERGLQPFLQKVQQERRKELDTIARHVELSLLIVIDRQRRQVVELL